MTAIDATTTPATEKKKKSPETLILLVTLLALVAWGASVFFFGIPGLYIPALAMVPVMYIILILISRG
jgi:fatty acid desaturase